MSYCRWSSMNWMCDVYTYEDVSGGWTTHVAGNRRCWPPIPDFTAGRLSGWLHAWSGAQWHRDTRTFSYGSAWRKFVYRTCWIPFATFWHNRVHMGSVGLIPLRPIGLPFDGETFNDPTPGECADRLTWLRDMGYKVPAYAIRALRIEEEEAETEPVSRLS